MEKNKLSKNSSLLVSVPALWLWIVLMLISALAGYAVLAGLFLFFLLLFSFIRFWSKRAMSMYIHVEVQGPRLLPPSVFSESSTGSSAISQEIRKQKEHGESGGFKGQGCKCQKLIPASFHC